MTHCKTLLVFIGLVSVCAASVLKEPQPLDDLMLELERDAPVDIGRPIDGCNKCDETQYCKYELGNDSVCLDKLENGEECLFGRECLSGICKRTPGQVEGVCSDE